MQDEMIRQILAETPDEPECLDRLVELRWPCGFRCEACGSARHARLACRPRVVECGRCGKQHSITAGTAMHGTKLGVRLWIAAASCVARGQGVAATAFARATGLRYETAWSLLLRVRAALAEEDPHDGMARGFDLAEVLLPTRTDGLDRRPRSSPWIGAERISVGVGAHLDRQVVRARRHGTAEARRLGSLAAPPACECGRGKTATFGKAAVVAAEIELVLGCVHGGVSRRWLRPYLGEREFCSSVVSRAPREVVERVLAGAPHTFRALRDEASRWIFPWAGVRVPAAVAC